MKKKIDLTAFLLVLFLLIFVTDGYSVTYRNDGAENIGVEDINGTNIDVSPGGTVQTYTYLSIPNFTKTSDEPYWNGVVSVAALTSLSTTPQNVIVDPETDYFIVVQITGTVDVYIQAVANTPAVLKDWTEDNPVMAIPARNRFDNLAITGSGNCVVYQYKKDN